VELTDGRTVGGDENEELSMEGTDVDKWVVGTAVDSSTGVIPELEGTEDDEKVGCTEGTSNGGKLIDGDSDGFPDGFTVGLSLLFEGIRLDGTLLG
jgi:hypothetical protein